MNVVCHMTSSHKPEDQRIFHKECVSLANDGFDVYLIEQGETYEKNGVHIIGTGEKKTGGKYRLFHRPKEIYRLALSIDADVYHFHDFEMIPYGLKLLRKKKRVVFDIHEDYRSRFGGSDLFKIPKPIMAILGKIYNVYEDYAVSKFSAIISVTPALIKRYKKLNSNTFMITNYPQIENQQEITNEVALSDNREKYVCYIGSIDDSYEVKTIVNAIQDLDGINLKMCGPISRDGYLEEIKVLDKKNKVQYLGLLPYEKVFSVYCNSMAAIATPRYSEGTNWKEGTLGSNKLFEAMLSGVPVIYTDFELWKEILEKINCGIAVEPGNIEEMRNAISCIERNQEERKKMGLRGRDAVIQMYNWKTQESILLSLYKNL